MDILPCREECRPQVCRISKSYVPAGMISTSVRGDGTSCWGDAVNHITANGDERRKEGIGCDGSTIGDNLYSGRAGTRDSLAPKIPSLCYLAALRFLST